MTKFPFSYSFNLKSPDVKRPKITYENTLVVAPGLNFSLAITTQIALRLNRTGQPLTRSL